jgi:acyl carrier protein
MQPTRNDIATIVLETLRELGEDIEKPELVTADESTRLFGARSTLDSMNLVNFIADVEERISDDFEIDITLANQSAMSRTHSPFRRVSSCIDYTMELITENQA